MPVNIISAYLHNRNNCTTQTVYQYNQGMILRIIGPELPQAYEVDFANSVTGQSITQIGNENGVSIPDQFFVPGSMIHAWVVLTGEDYVVTRYHIMIPISPRAVRTSEEPTPSQQGAIDQAIAALNQAVGAVPAVLKIMGRVSSLDSTPLAAGETIHAVGIPVYVADADMENYAAYGLTEAGWYVFARITAPEGITVSAGTSVEGAAGSIITPGADHVDVAVRFYVAAESQAVSISWALGSEDRFVFAAPDLATRNLDYRTTFYIYDIAPYTSWSFALTTDETVQAGKKYYTEENGVYTLADVTAGDAIPAETYYNHSKITFQGMVPNVTYRLDEMVDCPVEITLPEIPEDGHGAWFEIQMRYNGSYSCTLLPPEGVKIGTAQTQAQTEGVNTIDLQYTDVDDVKMWTLLNTHSNIPAAST